MKAIRIAAHGGSEVMEWTDVPVPVPAKGQILVRHTAIGVNFIDIYHRRGLYPVTLPSGLGVEAVGVVEGVGPEVDDFKLGDSVAYVTGGIGSYAEKSLVSAEHLFHVPEDLEPEMIASVLLKGLTSAYLLNKTAAVGPQMTILVHAAAGGVGQILCQWAASLGARVIGSVGSEAKAKIARKCGCSEVILYREEDLSSRVLEWTDGLGVDIVYDSVGADTFESSLKSCRTRGLVVSFGNASGPVPPVSPLLLTQYGSLFLTRPTLAHYIEKPVEKSELLDLLFEKVRDGSIVVERSCYPLSNAAQAHRDLESGKTTGSIVLLP